MNLYQHFRQTVNFGHPNALIYLGVLCVMGHELHNGHAKLLVENSLQALEAIKMRMPKRAPGHFHVVERTVKRTEDAQRPGQEVAPIKWETDS